MNVIATIGLGANLNDPAAQVEYALAELDRLPGTRLLAHSSLYASAPVGYIDQPDFINAVAQVETRLAPRALLLALATGLIGLNLVFGFIGIFLGPVLLALGDMLLRRWLREEPSAGYKCWLN